MLIAVFHLWDLRCKKKSGKDAVKAEVNWSRGGRVRRGGGGVRRGGGENEECH